MDSNVSSPSHHPSRREFLKTSVLTAGVMLSSAPFVLGQSEKKIFKVALIGSGGRGSGALADHHSAVKFLNEKLSLNLEIKVVAVADWSAGKARGTGKNYGVPEDKCFGGADAYLKAIEADPDIVIMGQPPAFRAPHFEAAIKAGKHVFTEKPVAVDPPGIRRFLAAGEMATQKGLCVVAGTQRRHDEGYNRRAREIKDGAYGRILGGRVAWNMGSIFDSYRLINPKNPGDLCGSGRWVLWAEMSGDHIVEQHVHNLDIANWYLGTHPVSAGGFGGRAQRLAGNMYDFFSVDLEYPNNIHIHSMCRQIPNCWDWVGEDFTYEKSKPGNFKIETPDPYDPVGYTRNPYVTEHAHLLYAILKGKQINETQNVAWATATAILSRESAYCGKRITWAEMFEDPNKNPAAYNLTMKPSADDFLKGDVQMLKDGDIRVPGRYKLA